MVEATFGCLTAKDGSGVGFDCGCVELEDDVAGSSWNTVAPVSTWSCEKVRLAGAG